MSEPVRFFQVDAFASQPFRGNPAAVLVLDSFPSDAWMQSVASEMNLSETAFAVRSGDAYRLRWFTPAVEVDLCGHATLATAHILWEQGILAGNRDAAFLTRSGELRARRVAKGIEIDLPSLPSEAASAPAWLSDAIGARPIGFATRGKDWWVAEIESEETVRRLRPDLYSLRTKEAPGLIVTAKGSGYDFVSRMFGPLWGIDEDPVTGAAHCVLAPYWAKKTGKVSFSAFQASARGGELGVELAGDRVRITGQAITVARGELLA